MATACREQGIDDHNDNGADSEEDSMYKEKSNTDWSQKGGITGDTVHGRLRKRKKKRDAVEAQRTENAKKKHAADVLARKDAMALYERTREAAIGKMKG